MNLDSEQLRQAAWVGSLRAVGGREGSSAQNQFEEGTVQDIPGRVVAGAG